MIHPTKLPVFLVTAIGYLTIAAGSVNAAITIVNHSFETDIVTGNSLGGQPPASWSQTDVGTSTSAGTAYVIDKVHSNVSPPAPNDGSDQMAMLRYDVVLFQELTTKIAPNTTYTLTIDAAMRNTTAEPSGSTIQLGTGSTAGMNLLASSSLLTPALNDSAWEEWQATFTTGATVADEFLRVEIYYPRVSADGDPQGLFDNVRLDSAPVPAAVPEPTTTALLGLGGLALILRRRK